MIWAFFREQASTGLRKSMQRMGLWLGSLVADWNDWYTGAERYSNGRRAVDERVVTRADSDMSISKMLQHDLSPLNTIIASDFGIHHLQVPRHRHPAASSRLQLHSALRLTSTSTTQFAPFPQCASRCRCRQGSLQHAMVTIVSMAIKLQLIEHCSTQRMSSLPLHGKSPLRRRLQ